MKIKKITAMAAAAALLFTTAGCSNGGTKEASEGNKITYWAGLNSAATSHIQSMDDMLMYQEAQKKTGIDVEFIHPPTGQTAEQFNLLIASGEESWPDIIEYDWSSYPGGAQKAIEDGIIINLNEMVEKYAPNLKKALESNPIYKKQSVTDNGDLFAFPSLNVGKYRTFSGLMIRKDWLDELGLAVPETLDEWEVVLKAFKDKGVKAPLAFIPWYIIGAGVFNNCFDVGTNFYIEDNEVKAPVLQPQYKQYIECMHRWYENGWIDQEFDTNNDAAIDAKMTNGTSAVTYGGIGGTMGRYMSAMKDKDPNYKLCAVPYPVKNKGDKAKFVDYQYEANPPFAAITTHCKNVEAAVKFLDFFYSEEGDVLQNYGVEGKTYNMVDGEYVYTDEILNNPDGLSIAEALAVNLRAQTLAPGFNQHENYLMQYYQLDEQKQAIDIWAQSGDAAQQAKMPPITFTEAESSELVTIKAETQTYIEEMLIKFIKGTETMDNYDAFVERLKGMGYERMRDLYQQAYERYENR